MIYLAIIFHMHQPYYKDLLTGKAVLPWVRLHGLKDYLDMAAMLEDFPRMRLTFNLVPSLLEQVEGYAEGSLTDEWLELSYKPAKELSAQDKKFILDNFFSINKEKAIALFPRYYELYFKKQRKKEFTTQDYLDLQVYFNLAWTDPAHRKNIPELRNITAEARYFSEEDKKKALDCQKGILQGVIPAYTRLIRKKQIEVTVSPYYHPILPLLNNTDNAKEANHKAALPRHNFSYPMDCRAQVEEALKFYRAKFDGVPLAGMWPSEEAVSEDILPALIQAGVNWIVADEGILFKSLDKKSRDTKLLYQPYLLKREGGSINIVFRDRNLSDLIGFTYQGLSAEAAVDDFIKHLDNIAKAFSGQHPLVTVAMDGENAWEYFDNDGHDFLELLYRRLSDSKTVKTTTPRDYLAEYAPKHQIKHLAAGSWIHAEFSKWIGSPYKNKAWEWLREARGELENFLQSTVHSPQSTELAKKQMHILEGSDWFWWYGEDPRGDFDRLFRTHLRNFYSIIKKQIPDYLNNPLAP